MPNKTEPTAASPGLLQRLFGSSPMTPEMQQGIDIAKKENPNLGDVKSYGPISRMFMSNAQGYTSPARTIYLNPEQMAGQNPQDVADTIIHEQTHVNQMKSRGSNPIMELLRESYGAGQPYQQRPDEMEAFQTEKDRRAKMGRIQTAVPSFTSGNYYSPNDVYLPSSKKK
jgi:hypothetical protein